MILLVDIEMEEGKEFNYSGSSIISYTARNQLLGLLNLSCLLYSLNFQKVNFFTSRIVDNGDNDFDKVNPLDLSALCHVCRPKSGYSTSVSGNSTNTHVWF